MEFKLAFGTQSTPLKFNVIGAFQKNTDGKKEAVFSNLAKEVKTEFLASPVASGFEAAKNSHTSFDFDGTRYIVFGLGAKKDFGSEDMRRAGAHIFKATKTLAKEISIDLDTFLKGSIENTAALLAEGFHLASYDFDRYKTKKSSTVVSKVSLLSKSKATVAKKVQKALDEVQATCESVFVARDFVNDPPNVLHSEAYAKQVEKDAKKIKGVKVKVLGKSDLKKEKMGMFLSVNAGSGYDPRLVHLTYTPSKVTSKTKHIALVGKGLTFDTGGYSLKPSASMVNMKFDMAGSATVYGAFRACAMLGLPVKISCYLGMTDNAVNSFATMPDSIVTARNGKTVEILNTDAEGRLVLGDVLSYACDHKPDAIINAATLTGACLVALGTEVCGLMGNDQKLADKLLKAAKNTDEYMWQLPIMDEWREDMKSNIADLKNIGGTRFAGTAKAAAFLENFVAEGTAWAHLDIAGIGDSQGHLPYCPKKGASGSIVRTLVDFAKNFK